MQNDKNYPTQKGSIEKAEQICQDAGFTLVEYSGVIQRQPSRVRCNACQAEVEIIVGELRGGKRKCPHCKAVRINTPLLIEEPVQQSVQGSQPCNCCHCRRLDSFDSFVQAMRETKAEQKELEEKIRAYEQRHAECQEIIQSLEEMKYKIKADLRRLGYSEKEIDTDSRNAKNELIEDPIQMLRIRSTEPMRRL